MWAERGLQSRARKSCVGPCMWNLGAEKNPLQVSDSVHTVGRRGNKRRLAANAGRATGLGLRLRQPGLHRLHDGSSGERAVGLCTRRGRRLASASLRPIDGGGLVGCAPALDSAEQLAAGDEAYAV